MVSKIIAYTVNGLPIDKQTYIDLINEADSRISSGDYTTIDDLEKELANW